MIELIISEFVTITLTILRGVSRTSVTKNYILDIAEVLEPSLLLQLLFLGSEKNINMCFVKLIFRKFEKILRKVFKTLLVAKLQAACKSTKIGLL